MRGYRPGLALPLRPQLVAAAAAVALLWAIAGPAVRAQGPATVRPEAKQAGQQLTVSVVAEETRNLAGFQMVLSWDPSLMSLTDVQGGDFLGKSGRRPECPTPVTDTGALRMACVTFNAQPQAGQPPLTTQVAGVAGKGVLAQAHFKVLKSGRVSLHLSHVLLVDPVGGELSSQTSDLDVSVHGPGGSSHRALLISGISAVAVLAVLLVLALGWRVRRRRFASTVSAGRAAAVIDDDRGQQA